MLYFPGVAIKGKTKCRHNTKRFSEIAVAAERRYCIVPLLLLHVRTYDGIDRHDKGLGSAPVAMGVVACCKWIENVGEAGTWIWKGEEAHL